MDSERTRDAGADELLAKLDAVGFTFEEARAFVGSAVPALLESYAWQADALEAAGLGSDSSARQLLAGVHGRALASETGLSTQRTWDGLRVLVPAVLRDSGRGASPSPERAMGLIGDAAESGDRPGTGASVGRADRQGRGDPRRPVDPQGPGDAQVLDVGFGLSVDGASGRGWLQSTVAEHPVEIAHPIFECLLRLRDSRDC